MREIMERGFQTYGRPLETFTSCKYLGQVLEAGYNNWLAVVGNLKKVWKS